MEVLGSNPIPCHWMDLCLVVPNSTPPRFVNSQLVSLPLVGILNKFLFNLQYLFAYHWAFLGVVSYIGEPVGRVKIQTTSKNSQRYYTSKRLIRGLLSQNSNLPSF